MTRRGYHSGGVPRRLYRKLSAPFLPMAGSTASNARTRVNSTWIGKARPFLAFVSALLVCAGTIAFLVSPASATGRSRGDRPANVVVHVKGNRLVDGSGRAIRLLGVDVDGTESACVNSGHVAYAPITKHEAKTIAHWGANAVRVPLNEDCWLGVNGLPADYSSARYRAEIARWVSDLNAAGLVAVLDLHWSAPGPLPATKQWPMADETHSVKFWHEVATKFRSRPGVVFDLFNEPALGRRIPTQADWTCWDHGCAAQAPNCSKPKQHGLCTPTTYLVAGMQQLLDAVRNAGAHQPVMVGGLDWAGDPCSAGGTPQDARTCMWLKYRPSDRDRQVIASFHTYGTTSCNTTLCWNDSVEPLARHVPVVTGEVGEKQCSSSYVVSYMAWADTNEVSYLVWSWQPGRADETCAQQGTRLLANWDGRTNLGNPAAKVVQVHLRIELRRNGRPA